MDQNVFTTVAGTMALRTDLLSKRFSNDPIGTSGRILQIAAPAHVSSQGWKHWNAHELARQALLLTGNGESPVCGWVDFTAQVAEVKDYFTMRTAFENRFGKDFDVTEREFRVLLQKLHSVFNELGVRCTMVGDDSANASTELATHWPGEAQSAPIEQERTRWPVALMIGLALILAYVTALLASTS